MKTPEETTTAEPLAAPDLGQRAWQVPVPVPASDRSGGVVSGRSCRLASLGFGALGMLGLAAALGQRELGLGLYRPTQAIAMFFHGASLLLPGLAIIAGFLAWHSRTARVLTCTVIVALALDATLDRWSLPSIDHRVMQLGLACFMLGGSALLWRQARFEQRKGTRPSSQAE